MANVLTVRGVERRFAGATGSTLALQATDQIIFGIIVIGVIGLVSDFLFKWANQRLFFWSLA